LQDGSFTRLSLTLGGILAGGETKVMLNAYPNQPFMEHQQYYLWRFANNDNSYLRQVMAGKINAQAVSSLYSPVVGAQFTNTPTTYRRSFGTYTLSDYTEPDWTVELYVNNVLVDYVKADASGFFTFDVPLVYGNSDVKLRFYGPWGEERLTEQKITIPYNFLPQKEFEYTIGTGVVEDGDRSIFSRYGLNYGMERHITLGGGIEYLSSVASGKYMPFVSASLSLSSSLLLSGEYMHGVRSKGILSYRLPSSALFELNYTIYDKDQTAINNNYREERKAVISAPFHFGSFTLYSRLDFDQIIFPISRYTMADLMLSSVIGGVSTNLTTYATISDPANPYIYSNFAMSFRFPGEYTFRPQTQYDYSQRKFILMKNELEKRLFGHGYLNLIYEKYFNTSINSIQIGLRYEFPIAQTSASARRDGSITTLYQSAGGSLIYDGNTGYLAANNRVAVGRGGIVIVPYLDLNCNGERDIDEPKASGLNFRSSGGRIERNDHDTTIYIFDLEPYTNYYLELERNGFDNISWQLQKPVVGVSIDPNKIKLVEIPVAVVGEVSGTVSLREHDAIRGLGRITVCIYDGESRVVASMLTESDGYFNFLGLAPGSYTARIDTAQLQKLQMTATPPASQFNILRARDGDVVDSLSFVVTSEKTEAKGPELSPSEPKDTTQEADIMYYFTIQIGAFIDRGSANILADRAEHLTGYRVIIEHRPSGKYYTCYLGKFPTKKEAMEYASKLRNTSIDFFDALVLPKTRMAK
jgi:hypothetical protein